MLVLLLAWASTRVITCEATAAYTALTLQGAIFVWTVPHGVQRMTQSPTLQPTTHHLVYKML